MQVSPTCPQCGGPMHVKKRITFKEGPAKLVFECNDPACCRIIIVEAPEKGDTEGGRI